MSRFQILLLVNLALFIGGTALGFYVGRALMQGSLDAAQVKADKAAIDKRMALDAMEAKSRADAREWEDRLNAIPDTGPICVEPGWVR